MIGVRIVGVPEHFNFPWILALDEGAFEKRGIELQWTDIPEGTGRMRQLLETAETDLAIILTEGLIQGIANGLPARIAQEYIGSPLQWGVHVAAKSNYKTQADVLPGKAAVSRMGSGSHLMAFVNARNQHFPQDRLEFEIVNNLEGAVAALQSGAADYFMWERFTTQPLVDQGIFRRIDVCPTPWPCFVIACRTAFQKEHPGVLSDILEVINSYTAEFRYIPSIDKSLANFYGQQVEAIEEWLGITRWSQQQISKETVSEVVQTLYALKLIESPIRPDKILA
ncbi:substrate-binding domain-containing protein [Robiginitalea sp. IMCC44478]|uniref:substrate-binding domain-containing protein n=1 Tax=Robiginitalea sp. IMCC44478 TaxID=3459122 RepID=UPI0040437BF6